MALSVAAIHTSSDNGVRWIHHELFHLFDKEDGYLDDDHLRTKLDDITTNADINKTENQAEVASFLFHPILFSRLASRPDTLSVIEQLTGCYYDTDEEKFTGIIPEDAYKKMFGGSGYEYYMKRSSGSMDADYRNRMTTQK